MKRRFEFHRGGVSRAHFRDLALLLAGGALVACASLGIGLEPLEANLVELRPLESTAFEQRFEMRVRLRNPNDHAVEIDGLRFELEVNGRRLATGLSDQRVTLPRLGETVLDVTTTTTLLDLLQQAMVLGERGLEETPSLDYALRGRVFLAGSFRTLSFERSGELQAPPPQAP